MPKFLAIVEGENDNRFGFFCPGCKCGHWVRVAPAKGSPLWQWNGDVEKPTISPSILTGHLPGAGKRCHSFVKEGRIQFLSDCEHELAGQTVDLPDWDDMKPGGFPINGAE